MRYSKSDGAGGLVVVKRLAVGKVANLGELACIVIGVVGDLPFTIDFAFAQAAGVIVVLAGLAVGSGFLLDAADYEFLAISIG